MEKIKRNHATRRAIVHGLYLATNTINGKVYVGVFCPPFAVRKARHRYAAFTQGSQYHFHRALRKYGWEVFEWRVVYESKDREHILDMERRFIAEHDSVRNGYNMTPGGEGTIGLTPWNRGMKGQQQHSPEARAAISKRVAQTHRFIKDGELLEIINLKAFCREHNLSDVLMYRVSNGRQKEHRGYYRVG